MVLTPEIIEEDAVSPPKDFDMDRFLNTMYHMFSTERNKVELICSNNVTDAIIDRFSENVEIFAFDMEHFKVDAQVAVNNGLYSWIVGFGGLVKIRGPEDVKEKYMLFVKTAFKALEQTNYSS